jgi:type II secretory pathway predicted ATPase ExeA
MYCDYWNLTKPPFDNVPDASMYVDCHESMENVISETIFAIKEGNECLTVIVGEVGLGKTLSLRVIIDSLEPEKYKVALITNPALSFIQLLREIIGQITGKQCLEKKKVDLLEIFNNLLFETADQGKKIVIVIDEANVLSPSNLDDLRLLTNMQDDERNLFTLLLVGQMEFAKTLEHPKRANLFQRIGTYGHLEKLPSQESVQAYIESRLKIAGTERKIFDDDAIPIIWDFSEHGIPRLINKICKLCMKAGETNEFKTISAEVAAAIADRFQKLGKTSKPQKRIEAEPSGQAVKETEAKKPRAPRAATPKAAPIPPHMEELRPAQPKAVVPEPPPAAPPTPQMEELRPAQPKAVVPEPPPAAPVPPPMEELRPVQPKVVMPEPPPAEPIPPPIEKVIPEQPKVVVPEPPRVRRPLHPQMMEEAEPVQPKVVVPEPPPLRRPLHPQMMDEAEPIQPKMVEPEPPPVRPLPAMEEVIPVQPKVVEPEPPPVRPLPEMEEVIPAQPKVVAPEPPPARPIPPPMGDVKPVQPKTVPLGKPSATYVPTQGAAPVRTPAASVPPQMEDRTVEAVQKETEVKPKIEEEAYEDVLIGQQKIKLAIPAHIIKQAQTANTENKNKLAGYWSAQILKGNPSLTHSSMADPVSMWFDVKNIILKKFNSP